MALKIAINGPQTGREEISASSVLRDGVLSLPVHPGVTASGIRYIARAVRGSL